MKNLYGNNRKFKNTGLILIAVAVVVAVLLNFKIQSVRDYDKEQQSMADAYMIDNGSDVTGSAISGTNGASDNGDGRNAESNHNSEQPSVGQSATGTSSGPESIKNDEGADSEGNSAGGTAIGNTAEENGTVGNAATETANSVSTDQNPGTQATPVENDINYVNCTITIKCDELSNNMDSWTNSNKNPNLLVPSNGIIVDTVAIRIKSESISQPVSVLDVLKYVTKAKNIAMTTALNSDYVKSIGQIAEKDAGAQSGWMYSVNSQYPAVGCSSYEVKSGDAIVWNYSLHE